MYDILSKEAETFFNSESSEGKYSIEFDTGSLTNGVYFCRLASGDNSVQNVLNKYRKDFSYTRIYLLTFERSKERSKKNSSLVINYRKFNTGGLF